MTIDESRDAFGHALLDWLERHDENAVELVERDDGMIAVSVGAAHYFRGPDQWGTLDRTVLATARGRVLDAGCGAGRFALALQERGHDVVAIDVSPLAIEVCRRRGIRDARLLPLSRIEPGDGPFDTVLLVGHNLGLLASERNARRVLRRLFRATAPGARIIGDGLDPYQTTDPLHLTYHARNREHGRMGGQIRMRVRYKAWKTPWFDYLFTSIDELKELIAGTGWHLADVTTDGPSYLAILERTQ